MSDLAGDMVTVYAALWRRLIHGEQPDSAFVTVPVRFGDDTPEGVTRRVLLIGGIFILIFGLSGFTWCEFSGAVTLDPALRGYAPGT